MKQVRTHFSILFILAALATSQAYAEAYVGVGVGASFGQSISGIKGNENLNYPDAPDNTDPTTSLLHGAKYTNLQLKASATGSLRGGYYFEGLPFGVEGQFNYLQPNFKRQNVTISHPGLAAFTGGSTKMTEDQQPAHADLYVLALNGMYRYQGMKDFTPYIGAGPAMYLWRIYGTGLSGIIPALGATGVKGPNVSQDQVTWGADFKVGTEYNLSQKWSVGMEYQLNWSAFKVDAFRSVSDGTGDYIGHSAMMTITRHF